MSTTLNLLAPLGETVTVVGDKVQGAGWRGHTTGLHTVAIRVANFRGWVILQASIVVDPVETDWYSVLPDAAPYLAYPRPNYVIPINNSGETSTIAFNFSSNAVWLRASVDRSYLLSPWATPLDMMPYGTVSYIMVTY
jgi:hypothetical protein